MRLCAVGRELFYAARHWEKTRRRNSPVITSSYASDGANIPVVTVPHNKPDGANFPVITDD